MRGSGLFALAVAAVLGMASAAQASDPVKLGFVMPTNSVLGKQAVQAAEVAVDLLREDGGILGGRDVELVVYDSNFSPVEGVAAAQRLIDEDGVKYILGEMSSTVALAISPVAQQAGALFMVAVPKHPDVTKSGYDKLFRLNTTTTTDFGVLGEFLTQQVKPQRIAYIGENNDYGRQIVEILKDLFKDLPDQGIGYSGLYDVKQNDFSAIITDAKTSGADTLFTGGSNVEQYANIIRGVIDSGMQPKHIVLSPGTLNQRAVELAGAAAEGALGVDIYVPSFENPLNQRFVAAYKAKYGVAPEKTEELSFESVWIVAKAIDAAGTAEDVDAVAKAIRATSWETPRGTVTFDETGQALSEPFIVVVRDGVIVPY